MPTFQISGKVPERNDMLMIFVKLYAIAEAVSFSNLALIRLRRMALFVHCVETLALLRACDPTSISSSLKLPLVYL